MSYDLKPKNQSAGDFRLGALSFPVLLEACGYLFSCINKGPHWYCVFGVDERMGNEYPRLTTNDGFPVTEEEAKIMARIARNFVAIQRSLPDENLTEDARSKSSFKQEDVMDAMMRGIFGGEVNWPVKIREDWVDKFEKFADWAEQSGGFEIW